MRIGAKVMRIGVVGYSRSNFDHDQAKLLLDQAIQEIAGINDLYLDRTNVWLVSGWTDMGIPGIAYRVAQDYGMKTMGIACRKAYAFDCYETDRVHVIGKEWGEESSGFLAAIDVLIRIGGGLQSHREVQMAKIQNIHIIEKELETIE
jgi:hypothetical protein